MAILRLTLSNRRPEITRVNFSLMEFLDEEGVPPATVNRVRLVVEELIVNVIQHAFGDDEKHTIMLDVRTEPRGVAVLIEDDGKPFDPRDVPATPIDKLLETGKRGGLGLAIIKRVAHDLAYERVDNKNRVRALIAFSPGNVSN